MGLKVRVEQAARLVGKNERTIRWHTATGETEHGAKTGKGDLPHAMDGRVMLIDTDDLARLWPVNKDLLAALGREQRLTPGGMAAAIDELRAEVAALRLEVGTLRRRLDGREHDGSRADTLLDMLPDASRRSPDVPPAIVRPDIPRTIDGLLSASQPFAVAVASSETLRDKERALDFLADHGTWARSTPKSWRGKRSWSDLRPGGITKELLLDMVLEQEAMAQASKDPWKRTWVKRLCGKPECPCVWKFS